MPSLVSDESLDLGRSEGWQTAEEDGEDEKQDGSMNGRCVRSRMVWHLSNLNV